MYLLGKSSSNNNASSNADSDKGDTVRGTVQGTHTLSRFGLFGIGLDREFVVEEGSLLLHPTSKGDDETNRGLVYLFMGEKNFDETI